VYAPVKTPARKTFFAQFPILVIDTNHLLTSDLNTFLNGERDHCPPVKSSHPDWEDLFQQIPTLEDIVRKNYPDIPIFIHTQCTAAGVTQTRIDYMLAFLSVCRMTSRVSISPTSYSDHASITLVLGHIPKKPKGP